MDINFEVYKKKFSEKATENGYSAENITRCLDYAQPLITKGLPVIYNTSHLSALVGYNTSYIKKAAKYPKSYYRQFSIIKKDGTPRIVSEPLPSLKEIQIWILNEILYQNKVSRYAKAYIHKRGIKDHVKYHTKSSKVLTMDIKKFFDSIEFELVEKLFIKMGYSSNISNLLTKLCYLDKSLPQGAPTSPYITNILLLEFDERVSEYCRERKIKYTRYSDDLAFSGSIKKIALIKFIKQELSRLKLKINNSKTRLMRQNQQQIISGLIVNEKIQVPKAERNKIRNQMFYIKKFGLESHMEKTLQTKQNYIKHLIGKINYILSMNAEDKEFIDYKKYLYSIKNEVVKGI